MLRIVTAAALFALLIPSAQLAAAGGADVIAAVLDRTDRPDGDREADLRRKPADVLEFFGVGPGMTVLDLYSGGGYYTEIVSGVVGDDGTVVAHNNTPYLIFAEKNLAQRFLPGRLGNVERLTAENNELRLDPARFDVALLILAYHDIYYADPENGWDPIDGPAFLAEVYRSLKPGGVLGVVDHAAEAGSPSSTGQTLHRIDPALMRREIEAAGFVFDGESDALRNLSDDRSKPMFDESVRGRTDRVIFRFRRPE